MAELKQDYAKIEAGAPSMIPTGVILAYAGTDNQVPAGWLLCDGQTLHPDVNPDHAALAKVLGSRYDRSPLRSIIRAFAGIMGGNAESKTEIRVPDLRGRVVVAHDDKLHIGTMLGAAEHSITIEEMPSHGHNAVSDNAGEHVHQFHHTSYEWDNPKNILGAARRFGVRTDSQTSASGAHTHDINVKPSGEGQPMSLYQPSTVVGSYIIKL